MSYKVQADGMPYARMFDTYDEAIAYAQQLCALAEGETPDEIIGHRLTDDCESITELDLDIVKWTIQYGSFVATITIDDEVSLEGS